MTWKHAATLAALSATCAYSQVTITEIKLHTEPADARVRPFENVAIQVRVYGRVNDKTGRIRRDGARVKMLDKNGGWLSKPYHFDGVDNEKFVDEYQSTAGRIFGSLAGQYVMQDAVLYTAPEKPGNYRIEATLAGKTATATIHVDWRAAAHKKAETTSFPAEPASLDPYRGLVEHYAPFLAQETWFQPKADYPTRFDYDGDWRGDNNWASLETGTSQAYVHYAVMETATHWFLIYNIYHPRDYSDKCVAGTCHENDNEGLILTIAKSGGQFGRLQTMETLAHNNVYSFVADNRIRNHVHNIDGKIEFYQNSHPVVFVESGGHGVFGTASGHARYRFSKDEFTAGTGITLVYKGVAERPKHANDRLVGYDLLPIYSQWWLKTNRNGGWNQPTFDDYFTYSPLGGRPPAIFASIGGAFLGRAYGRNKAKPFWGWHDNRTKKKGILAVGQWGLDPAYAVSQDLRFPAGEPFSLDYVFNPYLQTQRVSRQPPSSANPRASRPTRPVVPASPPPSQPVRPVVSTPPAAASTPFHGTVELRLWVDGSLEILIQQDRIYYQVISGAPYRNVQSSLSAPLPRARLASVRLRKKEGRGKVYLVEQPSAENGYSIRVRIDDNKRSGDDYHLVIEWER